MVLDVGPRIEHIYSREEAKEYIRVMRNALKKLIIAINKDDWNGMNTYFNRIKDYYEKLQKFVQQYNRDRAEEERIEAEIQAKIAEDEINEMEEYYHNEEYYRNEK